MQSGLFSFVYLVAGLVAFGASAVVWTRRSAPGGAPLSWLLLAVSCWALADVFEVRAETAELRLRISQLQ